MSWRRRDEEEEARSNEVGEDETDETAGTAEARAATVVMEFAAAEVAGDPLGDAAAEAAVARDDRVAVDCCCCSSSLRLIVPMSDVRAPSVRLRALRPPGESCGLASGLNPSPLFCATSAAARATSLMASRADLCAGLGNRPPPGTDEFGSGCGCVAWLNATDKRDGSTGDKGDVGS